MSAPETVQISIHKALLIDQNFCILGGKHRDLSRMLSASASASCSQSLYGTQHIWENSLFCAGGPGRGCRGAVTSPARSTWRGSSTYWWRARARRARPPGLEPPLCRLAALQPAASLCSDLRCQQGGAQQTHGTTLIIEQPFQMPFSWNN